MGSCILNYTRNQFCGGRKPECPEETLEVRLRSTETRSTYNFVVEVEGVIDVHYASLTSQVVQHRVFYRDGHPPRYQPRPTGLNFGEQTGTGVLPLVIADGPAIGRGRVNDSLSCFITQSQAGRKCIFYLTLSPVSFFLFFFFFHFLQIICTNQEYSTET